MEAIKRRGPPSNDRPSRRVDKPVQWRSAPAAIRPLASQSAAIIADYQRKRMPRRPASHVANFHNFRNCENYYQHLLSRDRYIGTTDFHILPYPAPLNHTRHVYQYHS